MKNNVNVSVKKEFFFMVKVIMVVKLFPRTYSILHIITAVNFLMKDSSCLLIADSPDPTFTIRDISTPYFFFYLQPI